MNKKYFLHFTWIITLIMFVYSILCILDNTSLKIPFFTYIVAMIIYTLPMSYIKSKEAELICMEFQKESGKEQKLEQIIFDKTKRELVVENKGEKIFQKKNGYSKWLTNEVVMKVDSQKIYLFAPRAYKKYFVNTK